MIYGHQGHMTFFPSPSFLGSFQTFKEVEVHHHCNSLWNTLHLRECIQPGIELCLCVSFINQYLVLPFSILLSPSLSLSSFLIIKCKVLKTFLNRSFLFLVFAAPARYALNFFVFNCNHCFFALLERRVNRRHGFTWCCFHSLKRFLSAEKTTAFLSFDDLGYEMLKGCFASSSFCSFLSSRVCRLFQGRKMKEETNGRLQWAASSPTTTPETWFDILVLAVLHPSFAIMTHEKMYKRIKG